MFTKLVRIVFVLFFIILFTMSPSFNKVIATCRVAAAHQQRVAQVSHYTLLESGNAMPNVVWACLSAVGK